MKNQLTTVQTSELKTENEANDFSEIDKDLYTKNLSKLQKLYSGVENSFLEMAFNLYPIYKKELYKIDRYRNIYDFGKAELNLSRGTCSEFINICENFCQKAKDGHVNGLRKEYEGYSLSKLRVLTTVNKSYHKAFSPDMTVREMKKKKKELENPLCHKPTEVEKERVSSSVELTTSDIFDRAFDSYKEFINMKEDFLRAFDDIKARAPHAKFRIVVEGIEV